MISICIPIYNFYAYPLVRRLATQIEGLKTSTEVEIVCLDDCSSGYYHKQNQGVADIAKFYRLNQNIGRARIRNLFLKYAQGDWLLFIDNDSLVPDNFLKKYLPYLNGKHDVVVGGRTYDNRGDDREHRLHYIYGNKVESLPAEERQKNPYQSFMACNFMVRRSLFEKIQFDQRFSKHGLENILFGYKLEAAKVPVLHIDNAVVNGYVENNAEFLHKTVERVENLVDIYDYMWEDQHFCREVRLLRAYGRIRRMGLVKLTYLLFKMTKRFMESQFVSGAGVSLMQFNFYQLGTFIKKRHYKVSPKGKDIV